jgi:hypothetical protein
LSETQAAAPPEGAAAAFWAGGRLQFSFGRRGQGAAELTAKHRLSTAAEHATALIFSGTYDVKDPAAGRAGERSKNARS